MKERFTTEIERANARGEGFSVWAPVAILPWEAGGSFWMESSFWITFGDWNSPCTIASSHSWSVSWLIGRRKKGIFLKDGIGWHKGCCSASNRWRILKCVNWVKSPIVANGILGSWLLSKRGVRQGDPLSPLLCNGIRCVY